MTCSSRKGLGLKLVTFVEIGMIGDTTGSPSGVMMLMFHNQEQDFGFEELFCLSCPDSLYVSRCPQSWSAFLLERKFSSFATSRQWCRSSSGFPRSGP